MSEGVTIFVIAVSTWLTPQPQLSRGLLVDYGAQEVVEDLAWFHGYELRPYPNHCGIASISPVHLGEIAWVRVESGAWFGPCLVVDVMARHHAYVGIYINREVAEVPRWLAERLGFENGAQGQVWFGACPPPRNTIAWPYEPPLAFDKGGETQPNFWPYPQQKYPQYCPDQGPWSKFTLGDQAWTATSRLTGSFEPAR